MLWRVDTRRKILLLSVRQGRDEECLGYSGSAKLPLPSQPSARPANHGAGRNAFAACRPRRQKAVCHHFTGPRTTGPLRRKDESIRSLPEWHLSHRRGFFKGPAVDSLCPVSGPNTVAEAKWLERAGATDICTDENLFSTLGARPQKDRFYRHHGPGTAQ